MWTHICIPSQGNDSILPCVVTRMSAKVAKHIQIRILVGRNIEAKAASNRHRRSLCFWSGLRPLQPQNLSTNFAFSSTSFGSTSVRRPSLSISSSSSGSIDQCQGQKLSATTVKVVSMQLESVRVEQNHCQGLQTVRASYKIQDRCNQLTPSCVHRRSYCGHIQLPMLHCCLPHRHIPQASMYSNPPTQRRWPVSPLAPSLEGRRGT